jgi:hypothetical protein
MRLQGAFFLGEPRSSSVYENPTKISAAYANNLQEGILAYFLFFPGGDRYYKATGFLDLDEDRPCHACRIIMMTGRWA